MDDVKYSTMCDSAYAFARENFDSEHHYEKLMEFYNIVIKKQ